MVLGRTIYVFIKLLPSILALRKDRVLWISDDKKDVDAVSYTHLTLPTKRIV